MPTPLIVFCLAIVAASLLGGVLPLATVLTHTRLQVYLSFAAGAMLGAAFFHMLPEAVEAGLRHDPAMGRRRACSPSSSWSGSSPSTTTRPPPTPPSPARPTPTSTPTAPGHSAGLVDAGAPGGVGLGHQGDGPALGGGGLRPGRPLAGRRRRPGQRRRRPTAGASGGAAWGVFLATVVHKPADALTIVSLMLRAGRPEAACPPGQPRLRPDDPRRRGPLPAGRRPARPGDLAAFTAAALAFSAGTFLCIALSDLLPELQFHAHDRLPLSIALLAGFAPDGGGRGVGVARARQGRLDGPLTAQFIAGTSGPASPRW